MNLERLRADKRNALLVIILVLVVDDVVELELVDTGRGGDDAEPVAELLLLEELLGPTPMLVSKTMIQRLESSGR